MASCAAKPLIWLFVVEVALDARRQQTEHQGGEKRDHARRDLDGFPGVLGAAMLGNALAHP